MDNEIIKTEENKVSSVRKVGRSLKSQFTDFVDFIRKQGIIGFAIAFILGGAISVLVASLVSNIVNPILGVLLGKARDMADVYLNFFGGKIMYGKFINDLINFFVIALIVYFGVKKLGLDKLDKPKN